MMSTDHARIVTPDLEELSRSEFYHKEMWVVEIIYKIGNARKLVWIRDNMDKLRIEEKYNPFFYFEYNEKDDEGEYIARNRVRQSFDLYWSTEPSIVL